MNSEFEKYGINPGHKTSRNFPAFLYFIEKILLEKP